MMQFAGKKETYQSERLLTLESFVRANDERLQGGKMNNEIDALLTTMYITKSRVTITEGILHWKSQIRKQNLWISAEHSTIDDQTYALQGIRCRINIRYNCVGIRKEYEVHVNRTIQLKTFVNLITSQLNEHPKNYKLFHQDMDGGTKNVLLLQFSCHKTLLQIGFKNSDTLYITDGDIIGKSDVSFQSRHVTIPAKKKSKKKGKRNSNGLIQSIKTVKPGAPSPKKQSTRCHIHYTANVEKDRFDHSKRLTLLFEEASELFQERRQRLNELVIKNISPKPKQSAKPEPKTIVSEPVCHVSDAGSKAGKAIFPVLIGHEEFLYKSSKAAKYASKSPRSIDLHGCNKEEALQTLNDAVPIWLNAAMKEHPYTIPVNIICGGGNQVLSEAVEHWIRETRHVANKFS